ncbi:MAG: hypothetical protein K2W33_10490 [Burkholderiales bacterium]|nr:hypothetical protein [Burkholderiales bacterium]
MQIKLMEKFDHGISAQFSDERPVRPQVSDLAGLLRYTSSIKEGHLDFNQLKSSFASKASRLDGHEREIAKLELEKEIDCLEEAANLHGHPQLFRAAASLAESFSTWFCHTSLGEDKRPSLERALRLLERQAAAASTDVTPLLRAASIRLGRPQVRDKVEVAKLLERANKYSSLTRDQQEELDSLFKRLEPVVKKPVRKSLPPSSLATNFDYSQFFWPPDERLRCRSLCREAKKIKDMAAMQSALEHLYRVALIAECEAFIYRKFIGDAFDTGMQHLSSNTEKLLSINYSQHGRIKPTVKDKPFLSPNDYKYFELVWGTVSTTLDGAASMGLKDLLRSTRG